MAGSEPVGAGRAAMGAPQASQTQQVTARLLLLPFFYAKTQLVLSFLSKKQFKYIDIYVF